MPSTIGLYVAIYHNDGVYKHWSLFVDGPKDDEKFRLHVMGSSQRYRFEMRTSDARKSASLAELIHLYDVDISKVGPIKTAARNAVIHNEFAGYNCQDYVLELLDDLEKKDIIDGADASYRRKKGIVKAKQEGF